MSTTDMSSSSSWRYLSSASNKLSSFKGLLVHPTSHISRAANAVGATDERRQSWRAWASQKIRGKGRSAQGREILTLFPGWAARRYHPDAAGEPGLSSGGEFVPFEVEAFVSGYAISCRSEGQMTRSQRAFIRLAKGFAALPRIANQPLPPESPSTEDLLNQIQIPKIGDEFRALEQRLQSMNSDDSDSDSTPPPSPSPLPSPTPPPKQLNTPEDVLQKLHYNLESRLQLFWSSTLPARTVRLHLFACPRNSPQHPHVEECHQQPLATMDAVTGVDGSFNARFRINWQDLCQHPRGVYIAHGVPAEEHDLLIFAELLPPPIINTPTTESVSTPSLTSQPARNTHFIPSSSSSHPHILHTPTNHGHSHRPPPLRHGARVQHHPHSQQHQSPHLPHLHTLLTSLIHSLTPSPSSLLSSLRSILTPTSTTLTLSTTPITHCPIRVISDIDDTIKMSGITEGTRAVFHNVFVKELKDGIIPGMGEWYTNMWERGVRFHYVSNGPYEYLSVLHDFFALSKLPPGSIKLKSYAGKSLLSGLLSAPAARKRAGVLDILDSFPDSKFILVGDSGEQDLELYADLARDYPTQILAVFIRDADESSYMPIRDSTGWAMVDAGKAGTRPGAEPLLDYTGGSPSSYSGSSSSSSSPPRSGMGMSDQQGTPRAKQMKRTFSGGGNYARAAPGTGIMNGPLIEEPLEGDTPKQKDIATFPNLSPSSTFSSSSTFTSMTAVSSGYITTPPLPVPPLTIPSSLSSSSSSSFPRLVSGPIGGRKRTQRSATDTLTHPIGQQAYENGRTNDGYGHSRTPTSTTSSTSSASASTSYFSTTPLPYTKHSRLSFSALGSARRRAVSAVNIPGGSGKNNNTPEQQNGLYVSGSPRSGSSGSSGGSTTSTGGGGGGGGRLEPGEKKRGELQNRVYTARTQMPSRVLLRVFRHPEECVEDVDRILGNGGDI